MRYPQYFNQSILSYNIHFISFQNLAAPIAVDILKPTKEFDKRGSCFLSSFIEQDVDLNEKIYEIEHHNETNIENEIEQCNPRHWYFSTCTIMRNEFFK